MVDIEVDKVKLFKYFNQEYNTFIVDNTIDAGAVPFVTGVFKQDAYLAHARELYGVIITRDNPDLNTPSTWTVNVIDDKKFSWLMLKL